jgi:hypothetical protein
MLAFSSIAENVKSFLFCFYSTAAACLANERTKLCHFSLHLALESHETQQEKKNRRVCRKMRNEREKERKIV